MSRVRAIALALSILWPVAGCDRSSTPAKEPRTAKRSGPAAHRIVSAAPNLTEICCALGLRDQLVGRTRYCTFPPEVETVPSIGALLDVNVERLLELDPDLILVAGNSQEITDRLQTLGLRYESLPDASLPDLFVSIRRIGVLTAREQPAAALCARIEAELQSVDRTQQDRPRQRVLILTGTLSDPPAPPFVAGPGSFYDALLRRGGHENVAAPLNRAFVQPSLEFILDADPDVIIELDPDGASRPGGDADAERVWSKVGPLQAVADQRVRVLVGSQHYVVGPRIADTYRAICDAIARNGDD